MLKNDYFLAKIGFDSAVNEPSEKSRSGGVASMYAQIVLVLENAIFCRGRGVRVLLTFCKVKGVRILVLSSEKCYEHYLN